jgi:N-acetylglucosaminyldiphosphoundecaprenol N-acetyl-beta-D-mannosaminyltransferase
VTAAVRSVATGGGAATANGDRMTPGAPPHAGSAPVTVYRSADPVLQWDEVREPGASPGEGGRGRAAMQRAVQRQLPRVRFGRIHAHAIERSEAIDLIVARARGGLGGFVLTPNVDHVAIAQHSPALVDAYRRSFLSLADGMPMVLASRLLRLPLRSKVSGSDVFEPLLARCASEGLAVFLLGSTADSCERAILTLKHRYPEIEITGYDDSVFDPERDPATVVSALHRARASGARIIICSLPPAKQVLLSQFMWEYAPAVGVATGGALGFFVGDVKRAPAWVSRLSFEWLWRLLHEPARLWRRYLIEDIAAFPVFLRLVFDRLMKRPLVDVDVIDITGLRTTPPVPPEPQPPRKRMGRRLTARPESLAS